MPRVAPHGGGSWCQVLIVWGHNRYNSNQCGDATVYRKQRYNVRGQLWDIRASTVPFNTDAANGDRGAIVNYYSNNFVGGGSGTDNNGNLIRQETYIPGSNFFQDNYTYDSLNRLAAVSEKLNGVGMRVSSKPIPMIVGAIAQLMPPTQ